MQLKEETLNKFEEYINAIGELITVVAYHLSATYQATTQIKSYAVKKKLTERMKLSEQETQPLSLFALTQQIEERYKIVHKFNKSIKRPFIPIPFNRDVLNAILNDLLNAAFEKGTSSIEYTEESKKITIVFRNLLNGKHDDYYLIEMCNTMCAITKQQSGPCRNQYEGGISNLLIYLGLEGEYKDSPDFEITKFYFIASMIRSHNMVIRYLYDFIMHQCQAAARINSIIKGVAEGFIDPAKLNQNLDDNFTTGQKTSVGSASAKQTQACATVKENSGELNTEQIRERCKQINSKVESTELLQEQLMVKFPAFYPSSSTTDELTSKIKLTGNELQHKHTPSILNACLTQASAWHDRIIKVSTMGFHIPERDSELATLNAITLNYCSTLSESITYLNQISDISTCLKQMNIIPHEPEMGDIFATQASQSSREKVKPSAPVSGANSHGYYYNGSTPLSLIPSRSSSSDTAAFFATHKRNESSGTGATNGSATGIQTESGARAGAKTESLTGEKTGAKSDQLIAAKPAAAKSPTRSHQ